MRKQLLIIGNMKYLFYVQLLIIFTIDFSYADSVLQEDFKTFATNSDSERYKREIQVKTLPNGNSEFTRTFHRNSFVEEDNSVGNLRSISGFLRYGVELYQLTVSGLSKLSNFAYRNKIRSRLFNGGPFSLPNVTETLKTIADETATPVSVDFYDVKLYGLTDVQVAAQLFTTDAEYLSKFSITAKADLDVLTLCGQHSVKYADELLDGTFCYDVVNVTYNVEYIKNRINTAEIITTEMSDSFKYLPRTYKELTFSSTDSNRWTKLRKLHAEALLTVFARTYKPLIKEQFRNIVEINPDYIRVDAKFIGMYQQRLISTLADLVYAYMEKLDHIQAIDLQPGTEITLQNFYKFSHVISDIREADETFTKHNVNVTAYYNSGDASDTAITFNKRNYTVRSISVLFTVELANAEITDVAIDFAVSPSTPIDVGARDYIATAIKTKVTDFIGNMLGR